MTRNPAAVSLRLLDALSDQQPGLQVWWCNSGEPHSQCGTHSLLFLTLQLRTPVQRCLGPCPWLPCPQLWLAGGDLCPRALTPPHAQLPPPVFLTSTLVLGRPGLLSQIKRPRPLPVLKPFNFPAQESGVRVGCRSQTRPGAANRQQPLAAVEQDPALAWHMLPPWAVVPPPTAGAGTPSARSCRAGRGVGKGSSTPSPASFLPVGAAEPHGWNWTTGTTTHVQTLDVCLISLCKAQQAAELPCKAHLILQ